MLQVRKVNGLNVLQILKSDGRSAPGIHSNIVCAGVGEGVGTSAGEGLRGSVPPENIP